MAEEFEQGTGIPLERGDTPMSTGEKRLEFELDGENYCLECSPGQASAVTDDTGPRLPVSNPICRVFNSDRKELLDFPQWTDDDEQLIERAKEELWKLRG